MRAQVVAPLWSPVEVLMDVATIGEIAAAAAAAAGTKSKGLEVETYIAVAAAAAVVAAVATVCLEVDAVDACDVNPEAKVSRGRR